jgi:multidrug efflux pump subunit AcrB
VDEVGNPTILATFTVIAAILPMAFVSGMMGPYMRPIPIGASVAMLASLAVAFIVTPWLAYRLLKGHVHAHGAHRMARTTGARSEEDSKFGRFYAKLMTPLMEPRARAHLLRRHGGAAARLDGAGGCAVQVKMLPFDNKSEFQVVLDLPEGTTLETTNAAAGGDRAYLRTVPEVKSTQVYAGTSAPFNFNGLVRHYFLRRGANVADVQVNLLPQARSVAAEPRDRGGGAAGCDSIARALRRSAKVAEIPPGPPVLSTLVAEVYAGDDSHAARGAQRVREVFEATPGVVDVDWTVEDAQQRRTFLRWTARARRARVLDVEQLTQTLAMARPACRWRAMQLGDGARDRCRSCRASRVRARRVEALLALPVATAMGPQPLGRFVTVDSACARRAACARTCGR